MNTRVVRLQPQPISLTRLARQTTFGAKCEPKFSLINLRGFHRARLLSEHLA